MKDELNLYGVFGMTEMECAARKIITKCQANGKMWSVPVTYKDMAGDLEQRGFLQLLVHGWMQPTYYKDAFCVNKEFIERIGSRVTDLIGSVDVKDVFMRLDPNIVNPKND